MAYLTGQVLTQADIAALFTSGTYTPTLVGMVIGTGGTPTNSAKYTFSGFPAGGVLTVEGKVKFGTAGQTFPAATISVSLPSGYALIDAADSNSDLIGTCSFFDVSAPASIKGACRPTSTTAVRFVVPSVTGTNLTQVATSTIVPFTWASSDEILYRFSGRCTGP